MLSKKILSLGVGLGWLGCSLLLPFILPTGIVSAKTENADPTAADPATAQSIYINDVSCVNPSFCVAVGNFNSDSNHGRALLLTKTGQSWTRDTSTQPQSNFERAQLNTVACSSATFCLAFGNYYTSQNGWANWTVVWNGQSWQQLNLSGLDRVTVSDVACPADNNCWAVGTADMPGSLNTRGRLYHYDHNNWSQPAEMVISIAGALNAISCVDSSHCYAVGRTSTSTNPHFLLASLVSNDWSIDTTFDVNDRGYFMAVDCTSELTCTMLGHNDQTGGRIVGRRINDHWHTIDQSSSGSANSGDVWQSVGCLGETCYLVGQTAPAGSNISSVHAVVDRSSGNNWQSYRVEPASAAATASVLLPTSNLTGITCFKDSCLAYGNYSSNGQTHIYVANFNGNSWEVQDPLQHNTASSSGDQPATSAISGLPNSTGPAAPYVATPAMRGRGTAYVAFGDSITTGNSIPTCLDNRQKSPWGCLNSPPPARPYPNLVASELGYTFSDEVSSYRAVSDKPFNFGLERVGIWGDTVQEAARTRRSQGNSQRLWTPQLAAVEQANQLVTGSLGINDLHFSDIAFWAKQYLAPGPDRVSPSIRQILDERSADFDQLFSSLKLARNNGAKVIVTLYYNPYDSPGLQCRDLNQLASQLVNGLDQELLIRSRQAGLKTADFRPSFVGHGAGSKQPYVFGNQCKLSSAVADWLPSWLGGGGGAPVLSAGFDPHPNSNGATAMANAVIMEVKK